MADSKISGLTDGAPALSTDVIPVSRTTDVATRRLTLANVATLFATSLASVFAALAHHAQHENGGSDEIDVTGLSGLLADAQTPLTENVQDIVGAMATDTATIDFTYTDATGLLTADVKAASVTEAMQVLADNTTQDVSTTKHGYVPKAPSDSTKFLNGANPPAWAVPAGGGSTYQYISSQQDLSAAGMIDITGSTFSVAASKAYEVEAFFVWRTSSTGMGCRFAVNGPASPTRIAIKSEKQTVTGAASSTTFSDDAILAAYDTPLPLSLGEAVANTDELFIARGVFVNGTNAGTFAWRMDKENVAGTFSIMPGSYIKYKLLN